REDAFEFIADAIRHSVDTFCPGDYPEEWDLPELQKYVQGYFPAVVTAPAMAEMINKEEIFLALHEDAVAQYEAKETEIGSENLREIERRVMLSVIDSHWREHLYEMDYLQEGINLRAMGQKDPLVEWQREGFDMFEAMMGLIKDEFVRYAFHIEVTPGEQSA